ncbi:MAG: GNAT family N-acetyltransferase [Chloroflexi bacterium]|nr:GNAT family N-acetyltransferase [Chloroflexota bacterium]
MEGLPELRTERLLLRPYRSGDVDDVFAYATDPEWSRYLEVPSPYTRRDAEEFVATLLLADPAKNPTWAVVYEGRASGNIDLRVRDHNLAEMGYSIAHPLWGQGLTTEAARAAIAYGFESMGLARIQAVADIRNSASWRVMEKLGMTREGVLRGNRLIRDERTDDVLYAILRDNWSPAGDQAAQQPAEAGPPELRTPRLLLRPFRMADIDDVFAFASDPEWGRYLEVPHPYVRRDTEEFMATAILTRTEEKLRWAIDHDGRASGFLNLTPSAGSAEVGYGIASALWGQGLTTEAVAVAIEHGFRTLGLERIYAYAAIDNEASWRVMEKLGMKREGFLRRHRQLRGEYIDDVLYAILRDEWRAGD